VMPGVTPGVSCGVTANVIPMTTHAGNGKRATKCPIR